MEYGNFRRSGGGGFRDHGRDRENRYGNDRYRDNRDKFQSRDRDDRFGRGRDRDREGGGGGRPDPEESVFSKRVRAGKRRTYFFDVRKTRGEDFFITITESTRREDGYGYKRHKLFLYKEDFNRFVASLNEVVNHVKTDLMPDFDYEEFDRRQAEWEASHQDETDEHDDFKGQDDDGEEEGGDDDKFVKHTAKKDEDDMTW